MSSNLSKPYSRNAANVSLAILIGFLLHHTESNANPIVPIIYDNLEFSHPAPTADAFLMGVADISSQYVGVLGGRSMNSRATQFDAFFYDAVTGQHLRTLTLPVPADNVNFRFASIAIDGNLAVVGATYAHITLPGGGIAPNAGAAYVYDITTGTLLHKIVSDTPHQNFLLGSSVDILGDRIVVGGWGSAYVFDATTGAQLAELIPSTDSGQFGISVSISETAIVAGSNSDQSLGSFTGAVFSFDPQTFVQTSKFVPADAAEFDNFGFTVAIDGNNVIANGRSGAYVFDAQSGSQIAKLMLPGNTTYIGAVDIQGTIALLGNAALETAMTFDWKSGLPVNQLVGQGVDNGSNFGFTVAIAGEEALVGAVGKSYKFRIVPEPAMLGLLSPLLFGFFAFRRKVKASLRQHRRDVDL